VLKQVSEALGLIAGAVGAVYLLGALVLTLRLQTNDLPTLPVVSNLPRELVISYGLTYAVVPWVLGAALVAAYWVVRRKAPSGVPSPTAVWPDRHLGATVGLGLVVYTEFVVWLVLRELGGVFTGWDAVAVGAAVVVVAMIAFVLWRTAAARYCGCWSGQAAVVVAAALSGLVVIPAFVEIGVRAPLAQAQLCLEGPTHLRGDLVGEAGDRVYIGENTEPHRVVSSPKSGELYVGPEATESFLCRDERRLKPTADQLISASFAAKRCASCRRRADEIRVSAVQPWFASAVVEGRRKRRFVWRQPFLFRRAEAGWHVVREIENAKVRCAVLAEETGVTADILGKELRVCVA
jgi:hypothetical protein